jgi:uncharacterized repeat protein (TIGR03803 family)
MPNKTTPERKFSLMLSAAKVVVEVVLVVALGSVPGAWAARKYSSLYTFTTGGGSGNQPDGALVFDPAGNLYGTTAFGGAYAYGTVFELSRNGRGGWKERVLHSFKNDGADGINPYAGVIFDMAGNLYGTTYAGGNHNGCTMGCGTVFKLTPNGDGSWSEKILHSFGDDGKDGELAFAGLIFDSAGNLYGTTQFGGSYGHGAVFRLRPNPDGRWAESVIHSFYHDAKDGSNPAAALIFDPAGNLYGTTTDGGPNKYGTVFRLAQNENGSWTESVLYSFSGGKDGNGPWGGVIFDAAGNLYGTTLGGGNCCGVVFELTPDSNGGWTENVIHSFYRNVTDGSSPFATLTLDAEGNVYGTTYTGAKSWGAVFELTHSAQGGWRETLLHSFLDHPGANPFCGLIFDGHGRLYGTSAGANLPGSVFEITP